MKKTLLALCIFGLFSLNLFSQTRYLDDSFVPVVTEVGTIYGQADALVPPYLSESLTFPADLLLDLYEPEGDTLSSRPCIVYAHGGAFLAGGRADLVAAKLCNSFAAKGYVVASIDYRLGFSLLSIASAERAVYRGTQDMKSAIRYLKENAESLNIDTTKVFAVGNSAGSIMAVHATYFQEKERGDLPSSYDTPDLGCISCTGNDFTHNDQPAAVANLWGGIADTSWMEPNDAPLISFHGTNDVTVSPNTAPPYNFQNFPLLMGSNVVTPRLENLNIPTEYYIFNGQGHEPWGIGETPYFDTVVVKTAEFFYKHFFAPPTSTKRTDLFVENVNIYPMPVRGNVTVSYDAKQKESFNLLIVNALGQPIIQKSIEAQAGNNEFSLDLETMPAGMYYLLLENQHHRIVKPIVKQ